MSVSLTSTGLVLNSAAQDKASSSLTTNFTKYDVRTSTALTASAKVTLWNSNTFTKKLTSSRILVQGLALGLDAWSYPYGGTWIRLRHSDGTDYTKYVGSQYTHNGDGAQTVIWKVNVLCSAADLGNKSGSFSVHWEYWGINNGSGDRPWESVWNWNSSDDARARQQGSTTTVMEVA